MELLLFNAGLAVFVDAALPADDCAGDAHAEDHEGHEGRVAPLDERGGEVEGLEGVGDCLEPDGVCGEEERGV